MDQIAGGKTKLKSPTRVHKSSNNTSPNNNNYQKYLTSGQKVQKQISDKKIKYSPRRVRKMKHKKVLGGREDFSDISRKLLAGKKESGETAPAASASVPTDQAAPAAPASAPVAPASVPVAPASVPAAPSIAEKKPRSKNKSSKRLAKRQTKRNNQRQVRVSKSKILTQDDIKRVERKIAEIRKRKLSDMKKELEKRGVKTTGKSNRLLKDIYLYSKMSNINFQHEK